MRIVRAILAILAAVFLLVLLLVVAVHTPPGRRFVLHKVSEALRSRGIDFQASTLRYNLFTLQATLAGVVVRSATAPDLPPLASVPRIRLRARWGDLFRGTIAIENATLEQPAIQLVIDSKGRDNIPRLEGGGGGGGMGNFFLGKLTVTDGKLRVEDRQRKLDMTLPWHLEIDGERASGAYALHFTAGPGPPIRYDGRQIPLDNVRLEAELRGETLVLKQLAVNSPHTTLSANGSLAPISDPKANLAARLRVDAAKWARILRLKQPVRGEVNAQLTATGLLSSLRIAGTVNSARLVAGKLGPTAVRVRIRLDMGTQRLALESANVSLLDSNLRGSGNVALTATAGTSNLAVQFQNLDVLRFCRALDLPVVIASRAEGTAEARWPGLSFSSASGKADLKLAKERQEVAEGVVPLAGSLTAVSQGGRTAVELRGIEAMATRLTGEASIGPAEKLEGTIQADVARLSDLMRSLATYQGKPPPREEDLLEGSAGVKATLGGTLSAPDAAAKFSATELRIGKPPRELPAVEGDLTVRGQEARLVAQIPALALTANVQVGLRAPYPAELTAKVPKIEFSALPFAVPAGLQGETSLTMHARANLQEWQRGTAEARIETLQARWKNLPIEIREPIVMQYQAEKLSVKGTVHVKDSFLAAEGALPLRGATPGDLKVQSEWDLATFLALLPEEQRPQAVGRLEVTGNIRGTLQRLDPSLNLSLQNARIDDKRLRSPITGLTLQAQLRGAILELQKLSAQWAGATLKGSGRLPLAWFPVKLPPVLPAQREPVALALELDGLKLQSIRGLPETVQGTVSVQARAEASEPTLDAVRATVTIPRLDVTMSGFSFGVKEPGKITMENGVARIAAFALEGPGTNVRAEGTADFHSPHPLDVKLTVRSKAGVLASFVPSVSAQGPVELDVSVKGTPANPRMTGYFQTQNARVAFVSPPLLAEDLNIRVNFDGNQASIARFDGLLNGGKLKVTGGLRYGDGRPREVDIQAQATGVATEYPKGLNMLSEANLTLKSDKETLALGGKVTILEGSYLKTLSLEQDLLPYARGQRGKFTPTEQRSALLDRLRFNVAIETRSPIVMDNNLGELAMMANLRLAGGYYNMGLLGRLTIEQGGELRLNERTYTIDRGAVTFTSSQSIEAAPDILAKTQAAGYDITLQVTKEAGKIRTDLTSQPPLSESNIIAVLLTGRTLEEARGEYGSIAQQQALSYVAGRLGQTFSSRVQGGLGLTTVRLEPSLISAESEPGARLTVAQDITPRLNLSYSVNLVDSSDQIWAAQYDLTRLFTTRAVKQSDNSYRFEMRHRMSFGGVPLFPGTVSTAARKQVIGGVEFSGSPYFPPEQLSDRLKLKAGDKYDFFKVQRGVKRLQKLYTKQDFLESRVRTGREFRDSTVDLDFQINSGPKVDFAFEGWSPPDKTQKEVRTAWRNGAFEEQRNTNAVTALRGALVQRGYLEAKVTPEKTKTEAEAVKERTVRFRIQSGTRFHDVKLEFSGADQISPSELEDLLKRQKLLTAVYLRPSEVTELLTSYYHEHGYMAAKVEPPRHELDKTTGTGKTVIPVTEGPKFRIGKLKFEGNETYSNAQITTRAGLYSGEAYLPKLQQEAEDRVREFYLNNGFSDVTVQTTSSQDPSAGIVNLDFRIAEKKQRVVKEIQISGNRDTSKSLVRKQLALAPGQVLSNEKLGESLTRLYETGAYLDVDIQPQELPATGDLKPNQEPVRLLVKVREVPPWDLSYGGYYDTDRGPGGVVDLANHNLLGGARTTGLRLRYDDLFREARLYLLQPELNKYFPKAEVAAFANRDQRDAFVTKRIGFSFQQEKSLKKDYVLTYGYRLEQATTISLDPTDTSLNSKERIAPLTVSLTRETRDDVLDATRGLFLSNALELGTKYLGSGSHFMRYVGQYFQYVPLSRRVRVPFSRVPRSQWVWASAIRLGLGGGFGGQELDPSLRFFAGGGTTIRGFAQDEVGPKDSLGQPVGGNAALILNQEIHFPIYKIVEGAAFLDVGNVYPTISDFNPFDVRSSAGLGLRLRTPIVLLRLDYGIKLDRKSGESFGQLFFSIGQAF
jgi:outer membrane protein assembly complex protein YaeT